MKLPACKLGRVACSWVAYKARKENIQQISVWQYLFPSLTCLRRLASPATMRTSHNWIWFFQLYLCSVPNTTSSSKSKSQQCFSLIATFCATWKYRRSYVAFTCISASKHKHLKALWFLLCAFVISGFIIRVSTTHKSDITLIWA